MLANIYKYKKGFFNEFNVEQCRKDLVIRAVVQSTAERIIKHGI